MVFAEAVYIRDGARFPWAIARACVALAMSIDSKFPLVTGALVRCRSVG